MKTKIMILMMMLCCQAAQLYSQNTYMPVLTDGKMWKLSYVYWDTHWQELPDKK